MPLYPALCAVLGWFTCRTLVRRGSSYVGVVEVLSLVTQPFPRKETCLLKGRMSCNGSLTRALTLGVSRGVLIRRSDPLSASRHVLVRLVGKAAKRMTRRVPVPYHASRDWRVRWERDRHMKCPGSRARVRQRVASLRSRPSDSLEPISVFDGSRRSCPGRFAGRSFRVRGYGRRGPCV